MLVRKNEISKTIVKFWLNSKEEHRKLTDNQNDHLKEYFNNRGTKKGNISAKKIKINGATITLGI